MIHLESVLPNTSIMAAFTQRQATPKKDYAHRGSIRKFESSDDDDSSDLSDSDEEQSWKRCKTSAAPTKSHRMTFPESTGRQDRRQGNGSERHSYRPPPRSNDRDDGGSGKRRKNNIWGSVAMEQNQEAIEREITHFGVDQGMERDVESYSYKETEQLPLGLAMSVPHVDETSSKRKLLKAVGEDEDDAWLAEGPPKESDDEYEQKQPQDDLREKLMKRGSTVADRFRRSNVKSRLGTQSDNTEAVILMKPVEIDESAEVKVIAGQLAYSLQEPKRHLVLRIVKILGVEKALEIYRKTEEIENDGGMMIMNRTRRRSPGGVFIQMMKTDPDISSEVIKEIFADEKKAFEAERKKRRRHTRKAAALSYEEMDGHHGNGDDAMEEMQDAGNERLADNEEQSDVELRDRDRRMDDEPIIDETPPGIGGISSENAPDILNFEVELPPPQRECIDVKENDDNMMFPKLEDIPKRNEDSDPEDGEVLDDDDDD